MPDGKARGEEHAEVSGYGAEPGRLGRRASPRRDTEQGYQECGGAGAFSFSPGGLQGAPRTGLWQGEALLLPPFWGTAAG